MRVKIPCFNWKRNKTKRAQNFTMQFGLREPAVFVSCTDYAQERKRKKRTGEKDVVRQRKRRMCGWEREKSVFACVPVPSPVSELSDCDLWLWDSQQSLLPVQYCYNWHLMSPDVLSSTALNTGLHLQQSQALFSPPLSLPFIFCIWGGRPRKGGKTRSCCERADEAAVSRLYLPRPSFPLPLIQACKMEN